MRDSTRIVLMALRATPIVVTGIMAPVAVTGLSGGPGSAS